MRVAWIGLGSMGKPMALSVLEGGHSLVGFARRPQEHGQINRAGGRVTSVAIEAVGGAELVCVNLFSEEQIREVMLEGRVVEALPAQAVLVIHSTVSPGFVHEIGRLREDLQVLDAGFSGSPEDASRGSLTLMVGGATAALERAKPVFATYSNQIAHTGSLGTGMTLKVINNLMFAANAVIARDALLLASNGGVGLDVAVQTLSRGSAGSTALRILGSAGNPDNVMTAMRRYLEKDVSIAQQALRGLDLGSLQAATREFAESLCQ
jgi:3-hydroxyisobutyrate dehydrogenase-like beta-hydroxyacid dehydrogenase